MNKVRSREGDTVPLILWQQLQRDDDAAEEAVYAANPGLEMFGPVLPAGVVIILPELEKESTAKVVNIWD